MDTFRQLPTSLEHLGSNPSLGCILRRRLAGVVVGGARDAALPSGLAVAEGLEGSARRGADLLPRVQRDPRHGAAHRAMTRLHLVASQRDALR